MTKSILSSASFENFYIILPFLECESGLVVNFLGKHKWFIENGGFIVLKCSGKINRTILNFCNANTILLECADVSLYNAWNQSLDYLKELNIGNNSYISFLGLDDILCQNFCESVAKDIDKSIDFIYGDIYSRLGNRYRRRYAERMPLLFQKKSKYAFDVFHPGMMNRWGLISSFKFDQRYYLAADLDFYIRLSESHNITYLYINEIQSIVGADGISNNVKAKEVYKKEWRMIEDELSVEIVKKSNRMAILSVIPKNKTLYKLIRSLYWSVVATRKFKFKC